LNETGPARLLFRRWGHRWWHNARRWGPSPVAKLGAFFLIWPIVYNVGVPFIYGPDHPINNNT
jgi:hypothetical protein